MNYRLQLIKKALMLLRIITAVICKPNGDLGVK